MTKPLATLPCTAQELETALHAVCDHDGLWGDGKIVVTTDKILCVETKTKGETN